MVVGLEKCSSVFEVHRYGLHSLTYPKILCKPLIISHLACQLLDLCLGAIMKRSKGSTVPLVAVVLTKNGSHAHLNHNRCCDETRAEPKDKTFIY